MKDFIVGTGHIVIGCASRTEAEAKFSRMSADERAELWRADDDGNGQSKRDAAGMAMYTAPDGQKIHAKSLGEANAQYWNANRGKPGKAAPGRMQASASATAFDEAGAKDVFAHRQKIFKTSGVSFDAIMDKTAAEHRLMAGTATRE